MTNTHFEVEEATIADIHKAFSDGSLTCRQLVEAYLNRIEKYDRNGPKLNSIITVNPAALSRGRSSRRSVLENQKTDRSTAWHSCSRQRSGRNERDNDNVRLNRNGRIYAGTRCDRRKETEGCWRDHTGKGNIAGLGNILVWIPSKSGETKNPYALDRDPGGSSSGTAAGVAANLCTVGIGEDTGGSIRLPASFTNLVGVRVTPGLISRDGMSPLVVFQDTAGPMTRTVTDAAI